jgi:hypothetical protein
MVLYHATTPKKAKKYRDSGCIKAPVRGFDSLTAALAWAVKTRRSVIYSFLAESPHKLPDHHNKYGTAWWCEKDVVHFTCEYSAGEKP